MQVLILNFLSLELLKKASGIYWEVVMLLRSSSQPFYVQKRMRPQKLIFLISRGVLQRFSNSFFRVKTQSWVFCFMFFCFIFSQKSKASFYASSLSFCFDESKLLPKNNFHLHITQTPLLVQLTQSKRNRGLCFDLKSSIINSRKLQIFQLFAQIRKCPHLSMPIS